MTSLAQELRDSQGHGHIQSDNKVAGETRESREPRTPGKSRSSQLGERLVAGIEEVQDGINERGVEGWLANTGVGQLYRGYGMGVGALGLVLVLGLITGNDDDGGWAEL